MVHRFWWILWTKSQPFQQRIYARQGKQGPIMDLLKGKRKPAFLFVGSRVTITHLSFLELVYCLCELMWSQGIDLCSFCVLFYVSKRNLTTSLVSVVEWRHHALSYVLRGICLLSFHILRTHTQGPEEMGSKTRRKPLKNGLFWRAVRQQGYGLRLLIFKMANNKVDLWVR